VWGQAVRLWGGMVPRRARLAFLDFKGCGIVIEALKHELGRMLGVFETKVAKAYFREIESK